MKKRLLSLLLIFSILFATNTEVYADKAQIQNKLRDAENRLAQVQELIRDLTEKQNTVNADISSTSAELADLLIQISLAEADIASKEAEINNIKEDILIITAELTEAEAEQQKQYNLMKTRVQYIYENGGNHTWLNILLSAESITDFLNKAEFAKNIYDYDRKVLTELIAIVDEIKALKDELDVQKQILDSEKALLENQKLGLQEQEEKLQTALSQLEASNNDYATQLAEAREEARSISALILELEAELRKEENNVPTNNQQHNNTSQNTNNQNSQRPPQTSNVSGSAIVSYANQFVGNPYVWGGNSLTNGIDCSHFVYQVLKNCGVYSGGYVTSAGWRSKGYAVANLASAQAGDIICYSGHVAIYDGHGGIVEAQSSNAGITNNRSASCQTILAIRRFI